MFYLILFNAFLLSHSTLCILFHSIIDLFVYLFIFYISLDSIPSHSILFYSIGSYSILFHSILVFHFIGLYSIPFHCILFPSYWILLCSVPVFFNSISFCYEVILKYFISFYSIPFHCILLCSIPVFFYSI